MRLYMQLDNRGVVLAGTGTKAKRPVESADAIRVTAQRGWSKSVTASPIALRAAAMDTPEHTAVSVHQGSTVSGNSASLAEATIP